VGNSCAALKCYLNSAGCPERGQGPEDGPFYLVALKSYGRDLCLVREILC
jgi:hypothetical protein